MSTSLMYLRMILIYGYIIADLVCVVNKNYSYLEHFF